jgi:hypothetical protein
MIAVAIDLVFNGTDDSDLESVDLPKAYLRFLLSLTTDSVYWLDANYQTTVPTSDELAIIENGVEVVTQAANA